MNVRRNELNPEIIDDYSARYEETFPDQVHVARAREWTCAMVGCMASGCALLFAVGVLAMILFF